MSGREQQKTSAHFNHQSWPLPDWELADRLRCGKPTYKDRLCAASIIDAYEALLLKTRRERETVVREIRKVMR
jgi:hypothetical protein